jgi:hypothetical protein
MANPALADAPPRLEFDHCCCNISFIPYFRNFYMLAKLTSKNQLTLPKSVLQRCSPAEYFDVTEENGRIVLTPVRVNRADAVRAKLVALGLREDDVADAVAWSRTNDETGSD